MSFNKDYFSQMAYGGSGGNSFWYYYSTSDNVASLANQTVNTAYFQAAFTTHGIPVKRGDIIFAVYSNATNVGSSIMLIAPADWDANGASVMPIGI
jgi:hypothetical protein